MTYDMQLGRVLDAAVHRAWFREPLADRDGEPVIMRTDGREPEPVPRYSEDPAAKARLLERMRADGIAATLVQDTEGRWNCQLRKDERLLAQSGFKATEEEAVLRAAMNFHHQVYGR